MGNQQGGARALPEPNADDGKSEAGTAFATEGRSCRVTPLIPSWTHPTNPQPPNVAADALASHRLVCVGLMPPLFAAYQSRRSTALSQPAKRPGPSRQAVAEFFRVDRCNC